MFYDHNALVLGIHPNINYLDIISDIFLSVYLTTQKYFASVFSGED